MSASPAGKPRPAWLIPRNHRPRKSPSRITASQQQFGAEVACLGLILGVAAGAVVTIFHVLSLFLLLVPMIGIALCWLLITWALGYRPVTPAERERVLVNPCWHVVTRSDLTADLLDPCQSRSRMFFAAAPWRPPARAVFIFTRPPDKTDLWSNIGWGNTAGLTTHQVTISTPGPLYIRRDGAVASTQPISISPWIAQELT